MWKVNNKNYEANMWAREIVCISKMYNFVDFKSNSLIFFSEQPDIQSVEQLLIAQESNEDLAKVMNLLAKLFDKNGDQKVDFDEFILGYSLLSNGSFESKCKATFDIIDEDRNGQLSREELERYLSSLLKALDATNLTPPKVSVQVRVGEFLDELFKLADVNGDNQISAEEFLSFREKNTEEFEKIFDFSSVLNQLV